jgi:hypothetical protein
MILTRSISSDFIKTYSKNTQKVRHHEYSKGWKQVKSFPLELVLFELFIEMRLKKDCRGKQQNAEQQKKANKKIIDSA